MSNCRRQIKHRSSYRVNRLRVFTRHQACQTAISNDCVASWSRRHPCHAHPNSSCAEIKHSTLTRVQSHPAFSRVMGVPRRRQRMAPTGGSQRAHRHFGRTSRSPGKPWIPKRPSSGRKKWDSRTRPQLVCHCRLTIPPPVKLVKIASIATQRGKARDHRELIEHNKAAQCECV
jgi:hypothetical protein